MWPPLGQPRCVLAGLHVAVTQGGRWGPGRGRFLLTGSPARLSRGPSVLSARSGPDLTRLLRALGSVGCRQLEAPGGDVLSACGFLAGELGGNDSPGLDASPESALAASLGTARGPCARYRCCGFQVSPRVAVGFSLWVLRRASSCCSRGQVGILAFRASVSFSPCHAWPAWWSASPCVHKGPSLRCRRAGETTRRWVSVTLAMAV